MNPHFTFILCYFVKLKFALRRFSSSGTQLFLNRMMQLDHYSAASIYTTSISTKPDYKQKM